MLLQQPNATILGVTHSKDESQVDFSHVPGHCVVMPPSQAPCWACCRELWVGGWMRGQFTMASKSQDCSPQPPGLGSMCLACNLGPAGFYIGAMDQRWPVEKGSCGSLPSLRPLPASHCQSRISQEHSSGRGTTGTPSLENRSPLSKQVSQQQPCALWVLACGCACMGSL